MKIMTVRNISMEMAAALDAQKRRRGLSLNRTASALIQGSLGVSGKARGNGLHRLAGGWSEDEFKQFEDAVAPFGEVDKDLRR